MVSALRYRFRLVRQSTKADGNCFWRAVAGKASKRAKSTVKQRLTREEAALTLASMGKHMPINNEVVHAAVRILDIHLIIRVVEETSEGRQVKLLKLGDESKRVVCVNLDDHHYTRLVVRGKQARSAPWSDLILKKMGSSMDSTSMQPSMSGGGKRKHVVAPKGEEADDALTQLIDEDEQETELDRLISIDGDEQALADRELGPEAQWDSWSPTTGIVRGSSSMAAQEAEYDREETLTLDDGIEGSTVVSLLPHTFRWTDAIRGHKPSFRLQPHSTTVIWSIAKALARRLKVAVARVIFLSVDEQGYEDTVSQWDEVGSDRVLCYRVASWASLGQEPTCKRPRAMQALQDIDLAGGGRSRSPRRCSASMSETLGLGSEHQSSRSRSRTMQSSISSTLPFHLD